MKNRRYKSIIKYKFHFNWRIRMLANFEYYPVNILPEELSKQNHWMWLWETDYCRYKKFYRFMLNIFHNIYSIFCIFCPFGLNINKCRADCLIHACYILHQQCSTNKWILLWLQLLSHTLLTLLKLTKMRLQILETQNSSSSLCYRIKRVPMKGL